MNTAQYTTVKVGGSAAGKYPLSTQTLDFIQQQILLLEQLSFIGGGKYILKQPDGTANGVACIDGEVLPITATPKLSDKIKYLVVHTDTTSITADGETYTEARTQRYASFAQDKPSAGEFYEIAKFATHVTNQTLAEQVKQLPQVVLNYLQDILAEKLPLLSKTGLTQAQLDAIKTPCVMSCANSVAVGGVTNYWLTVRKMGDDLVQQEVTTMEGLRLLRVSPGSTWTSWSSDNGNLHIECKIVRGTVYLRHGDLAADASIVLLRKKRRSRFRHTGGVNSYAKNRGKRQKRSEKTQFVHYKGIVLSRGEANKWYVPRCIGVDKSVSDKSILDKEINGLCSAMVRLRGNDANGNAVYKMQGVRNRITSTNGAKRQHEAYARLAVQAVVLNDKGGKSAGGEMIHLRYWLRRKKVFTGQEVPVYNNGKQTGTRKVFTYSYYRTITQE